MRSGSNSGISGIAASSANNPAVRNEIVTASTGHNIIETQRASGQPPGAASENLIQINGITKAFGQFTALHEVNLSIRKGEFLSLLGPSGCGKTTLLRIIAGFQEPSTGDIKIDGVSMRNVPPNKRPVNTVFQNYALFPHMTIADNIAFGPRRQGRERGEIAHEVHNALVMVGMENFAARYPRSLSGGQQQRIALARAIINRPRVLLLDEPLGALDLKLRKRMQFELKRLHDQLGITFIYVTHDQEEALAMSDRIAVMHQGRVIQLGTGEDIYRRPNSAYVADFIGEANLIDCVRDAEGRLSLSKGAPILPYPPTKSDVAKLMIRPEEISFGAPCGDEIATRVTVLHKVFLGHWWRVSARMPDGQEIVICTTEQPSETLPEVSSEVTIHWSPSASRVLDK
jgi:spermidine/putrescine transport system ATP-binding protein